MDELIRKQDALDAFDVDMSGISVTISGKGAEKAYGYVKTVTDRIKALPPVQPTQTNCEYCHTDRDGYVFPLEKNSHAFIDRDKIVLKANGWRGEAKIKYCPICGRRLTNGTD